MGRKSKSATNRMTTRRLQNAYGKDWRRHYTPQLPPPTPLGAIWRVVLEQAGMWPGPGGLDQQRRAVYEDRYPCVWVEDTATFLLLLGRYPPYFQADGTYAAGADPDVRRETARIKMKLYTQPPSGLPARAGWAGVLFGTAELLCPPLAWTPLLAHAFASALQPNALGIPTPMQLAQQLIAAADMAIQPHVNTEDATDCDDLAALTFYTLGVSFEQMERAHARLPPATLGSQRSAKEFEAAAARAITKILGTPALFIWTSGIDAAQLPIQEEDAAFINHGIRPDWSVSDRNKAIFATKKHLADFTARKRPTDLVSPFQSYTWRTVEEAIRDPASHLAHAYRLWSACSTTTRRVLDLTARPEDPFRTPIPVQIELSHSKQPPYPLSREDTKQKIIDFVARTPKKERYKLTRALR